MLVLRFPNMHPSRRSVYRSASLKPRKSTSSVGKGTYRQHSRSQPLALDGEGASGTFEGAPALVNYR